MTNPISSQITSTALNQNRATETVSNPALSSVTDADTRQETADNSGAIRQDSAVNQSVLPNTADTDKAKLEQAVSDINEYVQTVNRELQFRVDDVLPLGRSIVTVIDADTQETIREFPSEQALSLARSLKEQAGETVQSQLEGLIISAQA